MSLTGRAVREARAWTLFRWPEWLKGEYSTNTTYSGVTVTPTVAMTCSAVYAAVSLISEGVATLPVDVFQRYPDGSRYQRPRPAWMANPNPELDWVGLMQQIMTSLLLDGVSLNAYDVGRDAVPTSLWPLDPRAVVIERDKADRLTYRYTRPADGRVITIPRENMLHINGMTMPGQARGMSPVEYARQSIGRTLAAERFASAMFDNMAMPGAVITSDKITSREQAAAVAQQWDDAHKGSGNAFKTAVLGYGATISHVQMTPEQVQMLETMSYGISDVARWYRVPPHMIGDIQRSTSWGTGIAEQNTMYAIHTLAPWCARVRSAFRPLVQASFGGSLDFDLKFDLRGLMRGNPDQQAAYLLKKMTGRALTPNEWRALDDENPLPGGDKPLDSVQWQKVLATETGVTP